MKRVPSSTGWIELATTRFEMGSNDRLGEPDDDEGPTRMVSVGAFALSAGPVTMAQFAEFVDATQYLTVAELEGTGFVHRDGSRVLTNDVTWRSPAGERVPNDAVDDLPVTQVSWSDAQAYCDWTGTRLLREAEWSRAAREGVASLRSGLLCWCNDYYDAAFFRREQRVNPLGPGSGTHRVARGGPRRITARTALLPDMSCDDLSFWVVRQP